MWCVIVLVMRNMVWFEKVWCGRLSLRDEGVLVIGFLLNCGRCIVVVDE